MGYTEFVKHLRYKSLYQENELFWGLGIEEETYFQFTKPLYVAAPIIRTSHAAERYSVRYFKTYKPSYTLAFEKLFPDASGFFPIPFFVNAHAFNKMDLSGNHMTTYEKVPKPNLLFHGKTFYQELCSFMPSYYCCRPRRFEKIFEDSCIFDGDSIEFVTQNFYKATTTHVLEELVKAKHDLLDSINTFLIKRGIHKEKGLLMYPTVNPGFVVNLTNPRNISMFNNGTYHINITLPSYLGKRDKNRLPQLVDYKKFKADHKKFIRLIQWLQPLIIGTFGTSDPLSEVSSLYTKGSQRCAVSRYIGLCTYDTNAMPIGKIVTIPVKEIRGSDLPFWWYKQYHSESGYVMLDELGMDISYRKHYNHGVEIRFLDWFPESMLKGVLEFFIYLADLSLDPMVQMPEEAIMNEEFNNLIVNMLKKGKEYSIPESTLQLYTRILGLSIQTSSYSISDIYDVIFKQIRNKYKDGVCASRMI
jgi:hypothetical protein